MVKFAGSPASVLANPQLLIGPGPCSASPSAFPVAPRSTASPRTGVAIRALAVGALGVIGAASLQLAAAQTTTTQPASSQAAPAPEAVSGPQQEKADVIVVTGVGPARSSDEMIASTSVLTSDAITERLNGGLGDTLAGLPGVSSTSFGPGASRPIIRGLGAERVQVLTNGIGVIDASAASPDHAVTADPLGAERIEILRGPASLAYGGGATGGVINVIDGLIVDKLPADAFSGMAYVGASSADNGKQAAAKVTGVAGPLVGVLTGAWSDSDNMRISGFAFSDAKRADELANGANPADFAHGKLPNSAVKNGDWSAGLSLVGDTAFIGIGVRTLNNQYGIVGEETSFIDMNQTRYDMRGGLKFDGPITEVTVSGSKVDYDHTEFESPGNPGTVFNSTGWEARFEARHAKLFGLEGSFGVQTNDHDFSAVGAESLLSPTNTKQTGVFAYETLDRDTWGLEGGLRYDNAKLSNDIKGERDFDAINASFGAHVHLTDSLFLGGSISRTEAAPTDIELFGRGPHPATQQFEVGDSTIDTERGVNYEATLRWEGDKLHGEATVYRFNFDSFTYLAATGTVEDGLPVFQFTQAPAHFTGAELSGGVDWGKLAGIDWKSDASMDIVRAELDAGGNLPRIPPMSAMLGLDGKRGPVSGRIEVQYGAKQDRISAFELPTDSWLVLNANLGVDLTKNLKLLLEARNLTDEEVRVSASPLKEIAPQAGRNFRLALKAKF